MQKIQMLKKEKLSVEDAFDQFIRKCQIKNLSDKTIIDYQTKIVRFYNYIGKGTPISSVTTDTIDNFVLSLKTEGVKDVTINSYLRSIRAFLYYAMDCGYITPTFRVKLSKAEKKIKETYSDEELERLLAMPDTDNCTFSDYKTWTFENYLLGTGNRISTALNVHIGDIDFPGASIIIRKTKNRKQQIIPLSHSLSEVLHDYLIIRGGESEDFLFCDDYGNQASRRTYQQLVQNYNLKHNVNKTSCHLFRHTFAKKWILAGGDIFRLQKILGHSDLSVTKEYVNMFGQDLQMDFEKYNPLDAIMQKSNKTIIRM